MWQRTRPVWLSCAHSLRVWQHGSHIADEEGETKRTFLAAGEDGVGSEEACELDPAQCSRPCSKHQLPY